MKNQRPKGNLIVIILLILIVIGLIGYIVYDKIIWKEEIVETNKNKSNNPPVESLEVTDPQVIDLLDKLSYMYHCDEYDYAYLQDKKITTNDLENAVVYNMACKNINSTIDSSRTTTFNDFTKETLRKEIDKIVGKDYKFTDTTYPDCPNWKYDSDSSTYKFDNETVCGCTRGPFHSLMKTVKAEKKGNKMIVYLRAIFVDTGDGDGYFDRARTKKITNLEKQKYSYEPGAIIENDANFSKGTLYKIEFNLEDGNYIFASSEPVNN